MIAKVSQPGRKFMFSDCLGSSDYMLGSYAELSVFRLFTECVDASKELESYGVEFNNLMPHISLAYNGYVLRHFHTLSGAGVYFLFDMITGSKGGTIH